MNTPTSSSVTYNQISLSWTIITDATHIGRDTIIYYSLEFFDRPCYSNAAISCTTTYDQVGDGSWVELTAFTDVANRLATSKVHTASGASFSANKNFEYRVRA